MPPPLEIAIIAGIFSFIGAAVIPVVNYFLTEKSKNRDRQLDRNAAERARQFELYKVIYPDKAKAAINLMSKAGKLFMDVRAWYIGPQDEPGAIAFRNELDELFLQSKADEFLLGETIADLMNDFRIACYGILSEKEFRSTVLEGNTWAHEASFTQLSNALRRIIHIDAFDHLLLAPNTTESSQLIQSP